MTTPAARNPMTTADVARLAGRPDFAAPPVPIVAVTEDSRRVVRGGVFVAAKGEHVDGHEFIGKAVAAGAVAVVGDRTGVETAAGVPYFYAEHPRRLLGTLAHALAGDPSKAMTVIGVTGTNGKTSIVTMVQQILQQEGRAAARFGTLGYDVGGVHYEAKHTTPFGEELAELFAKAREAGMTHVAMEVSSHALEQERVAGIDFDVAAFTNLTQDHLDYHGTMDEYLKAKRMLFERLEGAARFAVINTDDAAGPYFVRACRVKVITTGAKGEVRAQGVAHAASQTVFRAVTPWGDAEVTMRMLGQHNVSNALIAIGICGGLGVSVERIAQGLAAIAVPGRFELIDEGQPFPVIVDYAHTEDGLRNVLQAARRICKGRVLVVFGCGGDRDRTKRPKMGTAAAELADLVFVTSDNPRTEDPERIILDILPGVQRSGKAKDSEYWVFVNREEAIYNAIGMAKGGDLVLIAGKGHEDYQILGTTRIHFDDREVARAALRGRA